MKRRFGKICLLVLSLAGATTAYAFKAASHVKAELISDVAAVRAGSPFWLGVRLVMQDGWHVYWKNPGQTGTPTEITWKLPPGFETGPVQWPTPERFEIKPLVFYGYEKETILWAKVTPPPVISAEKIDLKAHVEWLECAEECIPGSADVSLTLPVTSHAPPPNPQGTEKIAAAKSLWPLETSDWNVGARSDGKSIHVAVRPPANSGASLKDLVFFPAAIEVIDETADQKFMDSGSGYTLDIPISESAKEPVERLKGLLVSKSGWRGPGSEIALEIDVPVSRGAAGGSARAILVALCFSFLGGLFLNLMPCVLPVLSIKILGFVNQARENRTHSFRHGLIFSFGVLVSFWALAGAILFLRVSGQQLGWGFQLQSPLFVAVLATLFLLIALNLLGVFEVGTGLVRLGGLTSGKSGAANSFLSGVLATLVATPCTAPLMGSALGFALTQTPAVAFAIFTSLGIGMCAPYLILSANPQLLRFVPKPGAWMETFKQVMGFFMLATVIWLGWVFGHQTSVDALTGLWFALLVQASAVWMIGRHKRTVVWFVGLMLMAAAFSWELKLAGTPAEIKNNLVWEPYSEERVNTLRQEGRAVFVDFGAAWCLTCQVNERVVFGSKDVLAIFKKRNIAALKADWTSRDPKITEALQRFGRSGVPLYLLYPPDPSKPPQILPEILTPQIVLSHVDKM